MKKGTMNTIYIEYDMANANNHGVKKYPKRHGDNLRIDICGFLQVSFFSHSLLKSYDSYYKKTRLILCE